MNKILFSIFFFSALIFCFPLTTLGAVMEMTVTIDSIQIPERAEMVWTTGGQTADGHLADRPNTEFGFDYSRITVVDKNISVKALKWFDYTTIPGAGGFQHPMQKDSTLTFAFPYDVALAPYKVYAEVQAQPQGSSPVLKADCTLVPSGSNWYVSTNYLYYNSFKVAAMCPSTMVTVPNSPVAPCYKCIAFQSAVWYPADGYYFWRSEPLVTIN